MGRISYITNLDAQIVQHVEYVPFGEVFIEERNQSWNIPYLFKGKELDGETGLYYYGARYYNPRESIFLSVDPMFEETMTPYQYTYQNPIRFTDPTGMEPEEGPGPKGVISRRLQILVNLNVKGNEQIPIAAGESHTSVILAHTGVMTSVNHKRSLNLVYSTHAKKVDNDSKFSKINKNSSAEIANSTNCYGYVLTGGEYFVENEFKEIGSYYIKFRL
ncbi:RHS repeat domain-containing protein [Apibacter adventoris]|uniref:RHS repeat domain-containing protein n=1 Tax=Apibacter adventoris TaxID=1679466 RepID=UPI0015E41D08|nr:RHS repeat-associated core domain-containing protein [Apibacter adventoris]